MAPAPHAAVLAAKIDGLARLAATDSPRIWAFAVDDVRRVALAAGHAGLADLARHLEHALATTRTTAVVPCYLEAMRDAAATPGLSSAPYLALIGSRLHG